MRTRAIVAPLCVLAILQGGCGRAERESASARPNVLLVTIDTFRADRLGIGVAPAIDHLADSGIRFTAARATVPLTLPSHTTILTGLLPPAHGVRENGVDPLADTHQTVARLLKTAKYQTAAFVGAFVLDRHFGLAQGFDTYDDRIPRDPDATDRLEAERPASAVVDSAIAWLERLPAPSPQPPAPFFVWIHLYDPHAPYNPPPEFRARTRSLYDGEIAYADSQIARVLEWLRSRGVMDRTLVVVAGDHGEGLGEHGERTHGMLLYDSTLRVPLVIVPPGAAKRPAGRQDEAVSLSEIAPTILRAAGVRPPDAMKGRDLLDTVRLPAFALRDSARPRRSSVDEGWSGGGKPDLYSETEYPRVAGWSPLQALTDGRWKTIRAGATSEVYDLQNDPAEQRDLAAAQSSMAGAMTARVDALRAGAAASGARTVSPEAEERLRALGYVASSIQAGGTATGPNPASKIAVWNAFEEALGALSAHRPDAVRALMTLAAGSPDAPVFQTTYARALKDEGQVTAALAAYRQAARRWPADTVLLHDLAVAARAAAGGAKGDAARALNEEAKRADQAALALAPNSAMAHNGLGLIAADEGRPQDAAQEFERASAIDPNNASYWANLGNARRALGDRPGAEQAYTRANDVDPRAVDAANGLGVLLIEAQRPGEAVAWFERAVAAAPDFIEARLNLGIALQQSGQVGRAADEYRRVLEAPARYTRERDAAMKLLAAMGAAR